MFKWIANSANWGLIVAPTLAILVIASIVLSSKSDAAGTKPLTDDEIIQLRAFLKERNSNSK
jgi:hypothetical protein